MQTIMATFFVMKIKTTLYHRSWKTLYFSKDIGIYCWNTKNNATNLEKWIKNAYWAFAS